MKHINLTQMLLGCSKRNGMTVRASNPDGEPTVNRQSRLMSLSGKKAEKEQLSPTCLLSASFPLSFRSRYLRYAAMIFCVLAMSVGQVWGTDGDATSKYLNVSNYSTLATTLSYTNGHYYYYVGDSVLVILPSAYSRYGTKTGSEQNWCTPNNQSWTSNKGWSAPSGSVFKGNLAYNPSGNAAALSIKGTASTPQCFSYRITNCTKVQALINSSNASRTVTLTVYPVTGVNYDTRGTAVGTDSDKSNSVKILKVDGLSASTVYEVFITSNSSSESLLYELAFFVPTPSSTCSAYEFHYGTHGEDDWETACFEQVGETNEWKIEDFPIPSTTHFYVGYHGDGTNGWNSTWSSERAWTDWPTKSDNKWQGQIFLAPNDGALGSFAVGQATGAVGTLTIHSDYNDLNKYLSFTPNGYGITYGGTGHAFVETATANMYETDVVTLPDVSTTYNIGLATATDGTYVKSIHSKATDEAISAMGVTEFDGGKKKIYLSAGVWKADASGEKMAIWDATDGHGYWGANDNSFMTYNSTSGLFEGYVNSDATKIVLVRLGEGSGTPNWDNKWNQTDDITLSALNNKFSITGWHIDNDDEKNSSYTVTSTHPTTGQKGKFRMWANSASTNWYVHWIPYYVLSYDDNGGSGTTAQTERNSESSTLTVSVAANGFTAPTGKHFDHWDTEEGDGGTDYAEGADYTLTADATLYAQWAWNTYDVSTTLAQVTVKSGTTGTGAATHGSAYSVTLQGATGYNLPASVTVMRGSTDITASCTWTQGTGVLSIPAAQVTGNISISATGVAKTTAITLEAGDGGTDGSATATYGSSTLTSLSHATRTGYTQNGYLTSEKVVIIKADGSLNTSKEGYTSGSTWINESSSLTLYARWTATSYTLSYDLDGGSVTPANPTSYTIESSVITLNNPTKTGYTFAGWTGTGLAEATTTVTIAAGSTGNRSYTATWTANTYDVDFSLTNVEYSSGEDEGSDVATYGTGFSTVFAAADGCTLPDEVTVTIGGDDATSGTEYTWNASTGALTIDGDYILGDIVITVTGEAEGGGDCTPINASITFDNNKSAKYNTAWAASDITTSGGASYTLSSSPAVETDTHNNSKMAIKLGDANTTEYIKVTLPTGITSGSITLKVCTYAGRSGTVIINNEDNLDTPLGSYEAGLESSTETYKINDADGGSWSAPTLKTITYNLLSGGDYYIKRSAGKSIYVFSLNATGTKECTCSTPSAPTATSNGATAATTQVVSWTDGSNDKWDVYVSTSSSTPAAGDTPTASGLTANTYTFTGLAASTTYYWWVRSVCDASHKSSWVAGTNFETSAASEAPIPALISYYLQTPNSSSTKPASLSTDSIVTTPTRLKGDTLKNFVPVTLGSSLSITGKGKDDKKKWSAKIGTTPTDSATAVTDAYAAKLAFDVHDDYELNITSITLNVKSVTNASQIYRVKVSDGEHTVYGRVAPGKDSDNSVVFGSFSGIKFSGTVTLTLWVWSTAAAAEYRLKSPIQIDGTLTRKVSACTMPTQTFTSDVYTLGGAALDLSALFTSNSEGAVTYSVVNAGGTSATIVGSSFTASNTGTATIRATQAADGVGNYCAKSIETTVTVSGDCTPQSLVKTVLSSTKAGTTTGYNDGEYAGEPVIATFEGTPTEGGYKLKSGSKLFVTLKKGNFVAGDKINIVITQASDLINTIGKLLIFYNASTPTLLKTIDAASAGTYTYTLTDDDITTLGSNKTIGVFRSSSTTENNPYVKSVEVAGCRDWTVCPAPDAVVAGSETHNSAVLTVTDAEETGNYEFYYSTSSTAPTASTVALATGSALTKTITGLSASETYYYWVRSNCGGVTKSAWVAGTPATFTTTAAPSTYSVTYNGNGKTGGDVPTDATAYEEGDVVTVKGNTGSLAKTGYSFVGWNTASDGTGTFYPAGYKFYMDDANVTLHAVWVTGSCTTIAEGAKNASNNAIVGTTGTVTTTGASSNSSYVKLNNDDVSSSRFDVAASAGNAPFAAGDKLTVTVHNIASKGEKTMGFKIKGKAHTASVPANSSLGIEYTLTAADIESNGAIKIARNSSDDRYEAILVERCIIGTTFTVSFDKNGHGSAIADIENVPSGSKIGAPVPAPTAADYDFLGWYREAGGTNAWDFGTMTITKDTTLYAKWGSCAPTITTQPVAANYNQNGVASALTVAANTNDGGTLHYQWWVKENDLAEEDGSAIPGETSTSFTPSTELLGTSYYYCVVSNDCGNVKTNTAAVTIRDAKPDPTAAWTVTEPTHGGKGFSFSVVAMQNDEETLWDGTLTADMLSVSSEAVLGTVTVDDDTKTISGTYGVKGSATSPVTFYLLLPATETQAAKRLDYDRSFDECVGGDGSTHDIRVLKANKNITFGGGTVYGWDNPGEGFLTASTGGTVSTDKAGTKMESVFDTVYNTNKKAFWVMPYAAGIKKIKVYGDVRVKELVVSNVRKVKAFTSGKDANNIAFSAAYEGGGDNVASTGYHWFEIILEDALDANDIIYFTVSENFQISGIRVTEAGSGGTLNTSLEWSNSDATDGTVNKNEGDADFSITATRSGTYADNSNASLGAISYNSSKPEVATVDAATGKIHIVAAGTTVIKATLAASGCYKKAEITYSLVVAEYVCAEKAGTVSIKSEPDCAHKVLTVTKFEEGANTFQWYKDGEVITGATLQDYTATASGTYTVSTEKTCAVMSINSITLKFDAATATKIVDEWYVKNDRRTPDIALVQTTNATGFTVTNKSGGATVSDIGGCTFELKEDGIIYLHGTKADDGDAPSDMTDGDITLVITATACVNASPVEITIHRQEQRADGKPSVAFVVDGTLRKDGGTATSVLASKTSDRPLWKYLENTFALTGCNAYWSVDSKELRQYYSQFDAILITDDPNTSTSGTGGVSYVKAFGTMVDVRPILTMEAYVGKFKDGGWHVYNANPTSPDPRQVELKLECKNHDIFKGLNPESSTNVRTTTDALGNEYWHVIMVDTTLSPYHNTTSNYETLPALQGFDPTKFDKMLGVGTIFDGKLQGGVERQEEPAARMMILGIQNNAMGALTNEGKLIVKNAIEYLLKTNMEDVNDCSNYFVGGTDGHEREWHNLGNWTGDQLPDFETRARILAPVEISTDVRVAHIDIIAGGESGKVDNPAGSVTVKPTGTLIVSGTINRAKAPYYGIDDLMPTTPSDLILETSSTSQSALIFDNSNGETQATVTVHSEANKEGSTRNWQYLTSPLQETPVTEFFYGVGTYTYKHSEADGGWVRYGLGTTFQAFDAIGLTQNAAKDFVFYGPLAPTGEWELNLTNINNGNNLFGNSWTAPIDLKALVNNTDFDSNINLDLAIYNTGANRLNGSGEFDQEENADDRPGTWHHVPLLLATLEDAGWTGMNVIPAYQAFQLKATGAATLNIDYDKCVRGTESENYNEPLRAPRRPGARQAERDIEALRIAVSDANGIAYIYLLEGNQFTEGYDNGWELAYTANSKYGKLYAISPAQGNMMALARPSLEGTMVGFQRGQSNEYTITFNETEGNYYLNDLKTETSTLIQEGESYIFTVEEGEPENRFLITSIPYEKPGIATGVTDLDADAPKVQKIIYNDKLYIIRGGKVYSAEGQLVK